MWTVRFQHGDGVSLCQVSRWIDFEWHFFRSSLLFFKYVCILYLELYRLSCAYRFLIFHFCCLIMLSIKYWHQSLCRNYIQNLFPGFLNMFYSSTTILRLTFMGKEIRPFAISTIESLIVVGKIFWFSPQDLENVK